MKQDEKFKQEVIRLALSGGKSLAQTARDLGIKESLLYSWISQQKNLKRLFRQKNLNTHPN